MSKKIFLRQPKMVGLRLLKERKIVTVGQSVSERNDQPLSAKVWDFIRIFLDSLPNMCIFQYNSLYKYTCSTGLEYRYFGYVFG